MNAVASIRSRLGVTQSVLAEAVGVTQGNVSFYEKGQTVPPTVAAKLIEFARLKGMDLSYDQIYGAAPLTEEPAKPLPKPKAERAEAAAEPRTDATEAAADHAACDDPEVVELSGLLTTEPGTERADHPKRERQGGGGRRHTDKHSSERAI